MQPLPTRRRGLPKTASAADGAYDAFRWIIMGGFALVCILPMVHLLGVSLASAVDLRANPYLFFPKRLTFASYRMVFDARAIPRSLINSFLITVGGVSIGMFLTSVFAYGLSKREVPGNRVFNLLVVVFIVFQVGIIPLYITMRTYGLVGKYLAVIMASAINPFWCIIMRNFFEQLPHEVLESAKIEGASDIRQFVQIVLPMSRASFAAISLFYAVFYWNDYFLPLMFIGSSDKWPVTVWLYQMVSAFQRDQLVPGGLVDIVDDNIKATVILIAIIPIILVYPFLQRHFAQGVTLGAVKG